MSGILDKKSRVIDVLLTNEGRRQLALGDMRIQYVAFTDTSTYYKADVASGSADATQRLYFEASDLPQDQITFEANDSGKLNSFKNSSGYQLSDGKILQYSLTPVSSSIFTGSLENVTFLSSDNFAEVVPTMLAETLENFKKQRLISTKDSLFEDDQFALGPDEIEFVITPERPIRNYDEYVGQVNEMESLFSDPRLSNVLNFSYLPPLNHVNDEKIDTSDIRQTSKYQLGNYKPLGMSSQLSIKQLMYELKYYDDIGFGKMISFDPTSKNNTLVAQFFEKKYDTLSKLDVIDFGIHKTSDSDQSTSHIFFAGRLLVDEYGSHTFLHLFTLVFQ